jgi:hypothetical protein
LQKTRFFISGYIFFFIAASQDTMFIEYYLLFLFSKLTHVKWKSSFTLHFTNSKSTLPSQHQSFIGNGSRFRPFQIFTYVKEHHILSTSPFGTYFSYIYVLSIIMLSSFVLFVFHISTHIVLIVVEQAKSLLSDLCNFLFPFCSHFCCSSKRRTMF